MAAVSLGMLALGVAASVYAGATGAQAASGAEFRSVDTVFLVEQGGEWYTVKVDFLMEDPGDGSFEAAAAEARAAMAARFPNAVPVPEGMEAAYLTSGFKWMSGSTTWRYDSAGAAPSVAAGALSALSQAANTWGSQGANFHFVNGGTSSNGTAACGGSGGLDGSNTVGWGAQSGSVLAVTCTWFSNSGSPYKAAVEFDMEFDPDWAWTTGNPIGVDLQSVALHEFGHALGLDHSGQGAAVMYASYTSGTNKRTPAQDDRDGEIAIYGATGGPTNTPTSAATATPTKTRTPTPVPSATNTPGNGPTATPTQPLPTSTPTPFGNPPTATPTQPLPTSTPTPTGAAGGQPTATATATPTQSATATPTRSATATPTSSPTNSLPILPGANLIAWPGGEVPPAVALANVPNLRIVYQWDPATRTWSRYVPGAPGFVSNIPVLHKGLAYWFISTGSGNVPFQP